MNWWKDKYSFSLTSVKWTPVFVQVITVSSDDVNSAVQCLVWNASCSLHSLIKPSFSRSPFVVILYLRILRIHYVCDILLVCTFLSGIIHSRSFQLNPNVIISAVRIVCPVLTVSGQDSNSIYQCFIYFYFQMNC